MSGAAPDDAAFIKAEIKIMATKPPKRPATCDPKIGDGAIRRMLRTATRLDIDASYSGSHERLSAGQQS
jgi:hypothetical protein